MVLRKLFEIGADVNGKGPVVFAWSHDGAYCAIAGTNHKVSIIDRQGKTFHQFFTSAGNGVIALEWDRTNEVLAILQDKAQVVTLFTLNGKKVDVLETGIKDLCFMRWSKAGPQLALGSHKGGVLIYNRETAKKIPILGTHSKRIIDGSWNSANRLAMVGEDKILSVSDEDGNVLDQLSLKSVPSAVCFMDLKADERKAKMENFVCVILAQKSLYLHNIAKKETPIELTFKPHFGNIVCTRFTDDGYCIVGFSSGYCNLVTVHESELGTEVSSVKTFRDSLSDISYSNASKKCATVGDGQVRTYDLDDGKISEQKSEKFDLDQDFGALTSVSWSEDGQILTVATKNGGVYGLLTKIAALSAAYGSYTIFLSSLREMTIRNVDAEQEVCRIPADIEPNFVAIGPGAAGLGMNNQAAFYSFTAGVGKKESKFVAAGTRVYPGVVESLKLSAKFAAALYDGKALLHLMDPKGGANTDMHFPDNQAETRITSIAMAESFFIFGAEVKRESGTTGRLVIVSLTDFQVVVDFPHPSAGIKKVYPNTLGTRIAFVDSANQGFIFNPCTEVATRIDNLKTGTTRLMWDVAEYGVLAGVDPKRFTTYLYTPNSRHGPTCDAVVKDNGGEEKAYTTALPYGFVPVLLIRGNVTCQMSNGTLANVQLATHKNVYTTTNVADSDAFRNNLNLNRLPQAYSAMSTPEETTELAKRALHLLDMDMSIRAYRMLQQPMLVLCLEKIRHIQEKNVLIGHVSMILGHFNDAQNFFLRSSRPMLALEMRRDLMQWEQALHLAKTMADDQVPFISKEYAQQLEFRGEYPKALEHFQSARMVIPKGHSNAELTPAQHAAIAHNESCQAGAARCMIRTGNIRGGIQIITALQNNTIALDCAKTLESMKQYEEAGNLYEKAEEYERAATLYILETKNLKAAARVIPKIQSRSILVMYAKAKESIEGNFKDAEQAYAQAEDWDNVVRIKVEYLGDLHGAYVVVRKTRSAEAAAIVAKMCRKKGENGAAVEFLVLAKKAPEAFELAQSTDCMEHFEGALVAQSQIKEGVAVAQSARDDFGLVAGYYDQRQKPELAAQFYHLAGNFAQALTKYLQSGSEESLDKAVSVVGKARSDALTNRLIDFLMGEADGRPKDPSYIFKLYLALGAYEKAAKTSVLIAVKEQEIGNYRGAHKALVDTCIVLQEKGLRITSDMRRTLMILHSYLIVKHLVKPLEDHDNASRMLLRVARNIAKFPQHIPAILTSTVLECLKADFKKSAFEYSCVLLQNETYRAEINEKHKKKIEGLVRKRGKEEMIDPEEKVSPCPHCREPVPETSLECGACKNPLPFCIVTGKHMLTDDWSQCPHCQFPALFTPFLKLLREVPNCPMCDIHLDAHSIQKTVNPDIKNFV